MSAPSHDTGFPPPEQQDRWLTEQWEQEILPCLPVDLEARARQLGAFGRLRKLRSASDLLRALLAYALCGLSFRSLGIWAVLSGIGSLSEKAWRRRLHQAEAWIEWILASVIGSAPRPSWLPEGLQGVGIVLLDFSCLKVIGGKGDDLRVHLGYDLLAGRMDHVMVSDHHQAEFIAAEKVRPHWIYVSDSGYRQTYVATVLQQGGEVVVRRPGHDLHLEEEDGTRIEVRTQAAALAYGASCSLHGWIKQPGKGQRVRVRVILKHLPREQARKAREDKEAKARAKGRHLQEETLWWAEWVVLVTTLREEQWPDQMVLQLYRARWQIELLFKRMKTLLQMHVLRLHQVSRAKVLAHLLLIGWALSEQEAHWIREQLDELAAPIEPEGEQLPAPVLSSWTLGALEIASLKRIVWGGWSRARVQVCLPWLLRYLCSRRRKRGHQETDIRACLLAPGSSFWQCSQEVFLG